MATKPGRLIQVMRAEDIVAMAKDAARFRWLLAANAHALATIAWSKSCAACEFGEALEAIDAAMEEKEQE